MDNLFTSPELFNLLRVQGIAATGTTRLGRIDSVQIIEIKKTEQLRDFLP